MPSVSKSYRDRCWNGKGLDGSVLGSYRTLTGNAHSIRSGIALAPEHLACGPFAKPEVSDGPVLQCDGPAGL
jgi:hypothetical protein